MRAAHRIVITGTVYAAKECKELIEANLKQIHGPVRMTKEGPDWLIQWEMRHSDVDLDFLRPKFLPPREAQ